MIKENFVQIPNKMFMNTNNDEKLVYVMNLNIMNSEKVTEEIIKKIESGATDMKIYKALGTTNMTALEFDYVYDDFTDVIEQLYENLLILWADSHEINEDTEMPTKEYLTSVYLAGIPKLKSKEEKDDVVFERPSRFRKKHEEKENKTMALIIAIVNSEMSLQQFYDLEIELVIDILDGVSKRREEEEKKRKSKKRRT